MAEHLTLTMPADCTLRTAQALQDDVLAAIEGGSRLVLDCAAIERTDITFVQLVAAAARTAGRRGLTLDLTNLPYPVVTAFRRAGIAPHAPFDAAPAL